MIVQAITGNDGKTYARQQLDAAVRNGLRIQGYVWCFPNALRGGTVSRMAMFDGFPIEALWLDVEQSGLKLADINRDLAVCDQYLGRKAGIYSGRYFFANQGWLSHTAWSDRPLWDSNYDLVPVLEAGFKPYGGWTKPTMKQFEGSTSIGSVHQIDLNVA